MLEYIERFKDKKLLVIGDIILDKYVIGHVSRISPEAPIPVLEVIDEYYNLGGAANVANNIASLGATCYLGGVIGEDDDSNGTVLELMARRRIRDCVIKESDRVTTTKTRIVAGSQQIVRIDKEQKNDVSVISCNMMMRNFENSFAFSDINGIIIADYAKGMVTKDLMDHVKYYSKNYDIPIFVDPKISNCGLYVDCNTITPNIGEAEQLSGLFIDNNEESMKRAARYILTRFKCDNVLITMGDKGIMFASDQEVIHIPARLKQVYNVAGAGDTVISTFSLGVIAGMNPEKAAELANIAASVVISEPGTTPITYNKLRKELVDGCCEN